MSARTEPPRAAIAYPGVGVAPCGSEARFFARHRTLMAPLLLEASEAAQADLVLAMQDGSWPGLAPRTRELFGFACGCAVDAVYRDCGVQPLLVAGHSMGIYAALVGARALSFADGLRTTARAHDLARAATAGGRFGMGLVLGLEGALLEELLRPFPDGSVCLACTNSPSSRVLSGEGEALGAALAAAAERGALRAERIDVDLPFHNARYLGAASAELAAFLREITWSRPACPVVSSLDQRLLGFPDELAAHTARNLSAHVQWHRVIETMAAQGIDVVFESGPGVSLSQSARFVPGAPQHLNIRNAHTRLGP